ncbi:MAG: riboflavin synthase [Planctomycetota bacterium]
MFTGLVMCRGRVVSREDADGGARLRLEAGELAAQARIGDSVAVDGCCLTVVKIDGADLEFEAVSETLARTTLGDRHPGDFVNLELPLRPTDRLGGHFVQGHVDSVAEVLERNALPDGSAELRFSVPDALAGQIVEKGSVAVDGVSLTVAAVDGTGFGVALIPHTLSVTTLGLRQVGDAVNLEGDILAKYVASLVAR